MLLPPIWRGRRNNVPVRNRIAQFRAVLSAAQSVEGYRDRLRNAGLDSPHRLREIRNIEEALSALTPLKLSSYHALFTQRKPAWRHVPHCRETRSALLLPYAKARTMEGCHDALPGSQDLYTPGGIAIATSDLYNLSQAVRAPSSFQWEADSAMVLFCGMDAGLISEEQREDLWEKYQVPLFQHFVGTDGRVAASECELHAGLHIRPEAAVFENVRGQLLFTSLTDERSPALRMESGLYGEIESEVCECGRDTPRIAGLRSVAQPNAAMAVA